MEHQMTKKPMDEKTIFKNMMITVFAVASLFLVKNIISQTWQGAITIGICLAVFTVVILVMKKLNIDQEKQQLAVCIGIVLVVFCISINSGAYYSDDFPLYLAVVAVSGLYLVPRYAFVQTILIDVLLIVAYILHPEKADSLSQYIMCMVIFTIAAFIIYTLLKRGRAYIEIGQKRAEEAERLLTELKSAGEKLQQNCDSSVERIAQLEEANGRLASSVVYH